MSTWRHTFQGHAVWGAFDRFEAQFGAVRERAAADGQETLDDAARVGDAVAFAKRRLQQVDPDLAAEDTLGNLQSIVERAVKRSAAYLDEDAAADHIHTSAKEIGAIVPIALQLPDAKQAYKGLDLGRVVDRLRRDSGLFLKELEASSDGLANGLKTATASLASLSNELQAERERVTTLTANVLDEFREAEKQRNANAAESVTNARDAIRSLESQFASDDKARKSEFAELLKVQEGAHDDSLAAAEAKLRETADSLETRGEEMIKALELQLDRATELVSLVANTSMAGHFKSVADDERKQADQWRWWAIWVVVGTLGLGTVGALIEVALGFSFTEVLATRALTTLAPLLLAAYLARESAQHRAKERHDRKLQLDLSALTPFLSDLPQPDADALRKELAMKIFGQPDSQDRTETGMLEPKELLAVLSKAIDKYRP